MRYDMVPGLALGWYVIFLLISLPLMGIAWLVYWFWDQKMEKEEEEERKKGSTRLRKTKSELSDWAKQMANYKPPKRGPNQTSDSE